MVQNTEQNIAPQSPDPAIYPDFPGVVTGVDTPEETIAKIETPPAAEPVDSVEPEEPVSKEIKLRHPITYKDKRIDTLTISPERLTCAAVTRAERIVYIKMPELFRMPEVAGGEASMMTNAFWAILGGIACGLDDAAVDQLHAADMVPLMGRTQRLFFGE